MNCTCGLPVKVAGSDYGIWVVRCTCGRTTKGYIYPMDATSAWLRGEIVIGEYLAATETLLDALASRNEDGVVLAASWLLTISNEQEISEWEAKVVQKSFVGRMA